MVVSGCDRKQANAAAGAGPPPPPVTVAKPVQREVIEWDEYTGRLEPKELVEVRARVSGFIQSAPFEEGSLVNAGDLLFVIDPRWFEAELARAQAEQARAEAQLVFATNTFNRLEATRQSGAATALELEQARAQMREAEAAVAAAKATVQTAQLNVEWTRVTAPISGRISRKEVTPGNLINGGPGQATLLTVITSIDPIYAYVDVDERSVLKYQRLSLEKKRVSARDSRIPVFLELANETGFPHEGVIDFVDNRINPETGTLRGRGVFANPTGFFTPGLFARLRIPGSGRYETMLVPDAAIGTDQDQRFLLVVNSENVVERRPVVPGARFGSLRSIEQGITAEDRVIVNGLQRARPGGKVQVTEAQISTDALPSVDSPATQELPRRNGTNGAWTIPGAPGIPGAGATQPATAPAGGER